MATFNGEKYIINQLESIRKQSICVSDVVIVDDSSTDSTFKTIEDYIIKYNLNGWTLIQNKKNLGWISNFINGLTFIKADYVFLSDQDDIWADGRAEKMLAIMEERKEILCLTGLVSYIDINNRPITLGSEKCRKITGNVERIALEDSFASINYAGCTMLVRKEIINYLKDINCLDFPHDLQIAILAVLCNGLYLYNDIVIYHRIHDSNASGIKEKSMLGKDSLKRRLHHTITQRNFLEALLRNEAIVERLSEESKKTVKSAIEFTEKRIRFMETKALCHFGELLKWKNYYGGHSMLLGDLLYTKGLNGTVGRIIDFYLIITQSIRRTFSRKTRDS